MSDALRSSVSDLSWSLKKALAGSDLEQKVGLKAEAVGVAIAEANKSEYPKIKTSVAKLGPLSRVISFAAPSLWVGTFGSRKTSGNEFSTRINFGKTGWLRGKV